jgi:hypothetical protein
MGYVAPVGWPVPSNPGTLNGTQLSFARPFAIREFNAFSAERVAALHDHEKCPACLSAAPLRAVLPGICLVRPYQKGGLALRAGPLDARPARNLLVPPRLGVGVTELCVELVRDQPPAAL